MKNALFLLLLVLYPMTAVKYGTGTANNVVFLIGILFLFLYIRDKYISKKTNKEKRARLLKQREISSKTFTNIIKNHFYFPSCKKCDDNTHSTVEINSRGTAIQIVCNTCNKKSWVKAKSGYSGGTILVESWDTIRETTFELGEERFVEIENIDYDIDSTSDSTSNHKREHISQDIKDKVWNRDNGKCVECGSSDKLEFDHIIPFAKGGANTYRNIQLLCEKCNRTKSDKIG